MLASVSKSAAVSGARTPRDQRMKQNAGEHPGADHPHVKVGRVLPWIDQRHEHEPRGAAGQGAARALHRPHVPSPAAPMVIGQRAQAVWAGRHERECAESSTTPEVCQRCRCELLAKAGASRGLTRTEAGVRRLVTRVGLEPTARGLKGRCSTT